MKVAVRIRVVAVDTISTIANSVDDEGHLDPGPQRSRCALSTKSVTKAKGRSNGRHDLEEDGCAQRAELQSTAPTSSTYLSS